MFTSPFRLPMAWLLPVAALALLVETACADAEEEDEGPVWTIQIENDFFTQLTNTDRHYSNGIRISRLSPPGAVPGWLGAMAKIPSTIGRNDMEPEQRWAFSIGHSIFTPDDTDAVALVPDDRPYAGWAYLGFSVHSVYEWPDGGGRQDVFAVEAGIVGPSALGEEVQNAYHELIGVALSNGWDNQLEDEPGLQFVFERKWRSPPRDVEDSENPGRWQTDFIPHVSASLGNVITDFGIGATVRFGRNLQNDFGPPRIRPGLPGSERFSQRGTFDWYLFAGLEGRAVARNIFLDGNTWKDSHRVDRRPFVMDGQLGLALIYGKTRLTYTHVLVSPEFNEQRQWDQYGALTLGINF